MSPQSVFSRRTALWLCFGAAFSGACTNPDGSGPGLVINHFIPASFSAEIRNRLDQIHIIFDEPANAPSLYSRPESRVLRTAERIFYSFEQSDVDQDGKIEGRVILLTPGNFTENDGGFAWDMGFSGAELGSSFWLRGKLFQMNADGTTKLFAEGTATTLDDGGVIQFGDQNPRATIFYTCASGVDCTGDGGVSDGGVADGG